MICCSISCLLERVATTQSTCFQNAHFEVTSEGSSEATSEESCEASSRSRGSCRASHHKVTLGRFGRPLSESRAPSFRTRLVAYQFSAKSEA